MSSVAPTWMNVRFLKKILRSIEDTNQEVEVVKFESSLALPPGNNYLSTLYRVSVDYKTQRGDVKSTSLIVKIPLTSGATLEFIANNSKAYERELRVYKEMIPKMNELQDLRLTPRSFYCPLDNSLVLEDLRTSGYMMADRLKQLDYSHCHHFMVTLARMHALSVVVHKKDPTIVEAIGRHTVFNKVVPPKEQQVLRNMTKGFLGAMVRTINRLEGCSKYAEKVSEQIDSYWEDIVYLATRTDVLNVLNHGDTCTVNVLFKYSNAGEVLDAKLIDFQLSNLCTFSFDIFNFWFSSANEEVRKNHRNELFEIYRQTLNTTFQNLNCSERLSKEDFDEEIKVSARYSIFTLSCLVAFAMADPEELLSFNELSPADFGKDLDDEEAPQWIFFKSKYYKAALPTMLRQAEELGAFV